MGSARKVAVITGASQGIGAGFVRGFLDRGYRVVANSRSIDPISSEDMLTIAGDIADPTVADRVIGGAVGAFLSSTRICRSTGRKGPSLGLGLGRP
ncbi:MAG TPA: SDR family NAD(P)-dependent oxidoreductase [Isosphaeraceae bacterium]